MPQIVYPNAANNGTLAPQNGPYTGTYSGQADTVAKGLASESALGSRYAGDSSTGDRYASNPQAPSRYDVTAAAPPPASVPANTAAADRFPNQGGADRYDPKAAYVGSPPPDRYGQLGGTVAAGAAVPAASGSASPVNAATADRYGSGVVAQPAPGVGRYVVPSSDPYAPTQTPAAAPAGNPTGPAHQPSGEYMPGSIKRYHAPGTDSATSVDLSGSGQPTHSAGETGTYAPPRYDYLPSRYPQTATPAGPGYYPGQPVR